MKNWRPWFHVWSSWPRWFCPLLRAELSKILKASGNVKFLPDQAPLSRRRWCQQFSPAVLLPMSRTWNQVISSWTTHIPSSLPWVSCDLLIPGVRILDWKPGPAEHLHLFRVWRTQEPGQAQIEQARKPRSYASRNYNRVTDQGEG